METENVEVVYYTCLNNDCPKHRNIFAEGDPQHEGCARERLFVDDTRASQPRWLWFAVPAALALAAAAAVLAMRLRKRTNGTTMLRGEENTKTWSGSHAYREDRPGNAVPPPIG